MTTDEAITCFAVTDQSAIIPLREIERVTHTDEDGDYTIITTEICGEVERQHHCEVHHGAHFNTLWLGDDGKPDKGSVFMTFDEAKTDAIKMLERKIHHTEADLQLLKNRLATFN